ncbi:hypothetical protein [Streptomyces clavuligerus]|uniref:hypothetical protein n=1 Tax=Streptomyces clavuligerus TaxID=1901 RepID=UPI0013C4F08C|nr:hypothetical protein [Streptomyces clavuligerus]
MAGWSISSAAKKRLEQGAALVEQAVEIPGEATYGLVSSAAYTSELFGWTFDGDCWNGGARRGGL